MKNDKYIVYFISRTKHKMTSYIQNQLKEKNLLDISPSHGNILTALYEGNEKMSMGEIGSKIGKDKATVTHLINKLILLGYTEKEKDIKDKRITYIKLTKKGEEIKEKFDLISSNVYTTAYNNFTEKEKETFLHLLKKMNQNFTLS